MPQKWHPDRLPSGLRQKNGIHWVAPGDVADQSGYPEIWVRAYHASQDEGGYWFVVTEYGNDGHYEVSAVGIHYLYELLDDMRRSAKNCSGVEIWIDNPHREEGGDDRELVDNQKNAPSRHARLSRKKKT